MNFDKFEAVSLGLANFFETIRADLICHVYLFLVLWLTGALDAFSIQIDTALIKGLRTSEAYGILKELEFLKILVPMFLLLSVFIYGVVLHTLGRALVHVLGIFLAPSVGTSMPQNNRRINSCLALVALSMEQREVRIGEIWSEVGRLSARLRAQYPDEHKKFMQSLPQRDASVFLMDTSVFLFIWLMTPLSGLSDYSPHVHTHFWQTTLLLLSAWLWAVVRWRRLTAILPTAELMFVAYMIYLDDGFSDTVRAAKSHGNYVRRQIEENRVRERISPTMIRLLVDKIGRRGKQGSGRRRQLRGWPFQSVYERGRAFWQDYEEGKDGNLNDYLCYFYYSWYVKIRVRSSGRPR
jgi:hypothetical protein